MTRRSRNQDEAAASEGTDATLGRSSLSDEQATQLAETYNQADDVAKSDDSGFKAGYDAAQRDHGAQSFHLRREILMCCVHGIRIPVKDGESPGAVALRTVEIAQKIILRAKECGLIDNQTQQGEQFKQYDGVEQLNVAKPE